MVATVIEPSVARAMSSISLSTCRKARPSALHRQPRLRLGGAWLFEQLDHVEQRRAPRIAGELIAAAGAAHRAHQPGAAHHVHDLGQVVTGDAVFLADVGDRQLLALARGQFEHREDGKLGRYLQSHDSPSFCRQVKPRCVQSRSFSSWR